MMTRHLVCVALVALTLSVVVAQESSPNPTTTTTMGPTTTTPTTTTGTPTTGTPSTKPTPRPSRRPSAAPSARPSAAPSAAPSPPTHAPTKRPTHAPTQEPTSSPSPRPVDFEVWPAADTLPRRVAADFSMQLLQQGQLEASGFDAFDNRRTYWAQRVEGRVVTLRNPLRHFSVLPPLGVGVAQCGNASTVRATARAHGCTAATNAGFFDTVAETCHGSVISRGRIVQDATTTTNAHFGVTEDGDFVTGYFIGSDAPAIRARMAAMGGRTATADGKAKAKAKGKGGESEPGKPAPAGKPFHGADAAAPGGVRPVVFRDLVAGVGWLVRNGESYVQSAAHTEDWSTQETGKSFIEVLSARTAVGHDAAGNLLLLSVTGQTWSHGVNLYQLAQMMVELGAINAINLDGGGSATLVVNGTTVNIPSDHCPDGNPPDPQHRVRCERRVTTVTCVHPFSPGEEGSVTADEERGGWPAPAAPGSSGNHHQKLPPAARAAAAAFDANVVDDLAWLDEERWQCPHLCHGHGHCARPVTRAPTGAPSTRAPTVTDAPSFAPSPHPTDAAQPTLGPSEPPTPGPAPGPPPPGERRLQGSGAKGKATKKPAPRAPRKHTRRPTPWPTRRPSVPPPTPAPGPPRCFCDPGWAPPRCERRACPRRGAAAEQRTRRAGDGDGDGDGGGGGGDDDGESNGYADDDYDDLAWGFDESGGADERTELERLLLVASGFGGGPAAAAARARGVAGDGAECGGLGLRGNCTAGGACACPPAFGGPACGRLACPRGCSGHGACRSHQLGALADAAHAWAASQQRAASPPAGAGGDGGEAPAPTPAPARPWHVRGGSPADVAAVAAALRKADNRCVCDAPFEGSDCGVRVRDAPPNPVDAKFVPVVTAVGAALLISLLFNAYQCRGRRRGGGRGRAGSPRFTKLPDTSWCEDDGDDEFEARGRRGKGEDARGNQEDDEEDAEESSSEEDDDDDEEGEESDSSDDGDEGAVAVQMQSSGRRSWLQRFGGRRVKGAGAAAATRGAVSTGAAVNVEMVGLQMDGGGWSTDEGGDERSALARR